MSKKTKTDWTTINRTCGFYECIKCVFYEGCPDQKQETGTMRTMMNQFTLEDIDYLHSKGIIFELKAGQIKSMEFEKAGTL